jgi:SAM-dependent methyltransferase
MNEIELGFCARVPANSSRFFDEESMALSQPMADVELIYDQVSNIVVNRKFNLDSIIYDDMYCTSVSNISGTIQIPTTEYFSQIMELIGTDIKVVDIGCGQGEFVEYLQNVGIWATGYDPALISENENLVKDYWSEKFDPADLYVMRCVLPHIPNPWRFVSRIFDVNPNARVLVEFQDLNWILENRIWWQISHDHVNVFAKRDFEFPFTVVSSGNFANGEWSWVLIENKLFNDDPHSNAFNIDKSRVVDYQSKLQEEFGFLSQSRENAICRAKEISSIGDFGIWGSAGKGIVLASTFVQHQVKNFIAIDADKKRWGKFLECSGRPVYSGEDGLKRLGLGASVIVSNPNHMNDIKGFVQNRVSLIRL